MSIVLVEKSIKVYFYFTRYTIPGEIASDAAYVGLILNLIRQFPSGLNVAFIIFTKICKCCMSDSLYEAMNEYNETYDVTQYLDIHDVSKIDANQVWIDYYFRCRLPVRIDGT